jgi:hypothetical protein
MWAAVRADGTLARSRGTTAASRPSNGTYLITFNSTVEACAFTATVSSVTAQTFPSNTRLGFAEAVPVSGQPSQVRIFVYDRVGTSGVNDDFYLTVAC